jgi:hypothetical protein
LNFSILVLNPQANSASHVLAVGSAVSKSSPWLITECLGLLP